MRWDTHYEGYALALRQFCAGVLVGQVKTGRCGGRESAGGCDCLRMYRVDSTCFLGMSQISFTLSEMVSSCFSTT